tara:strand:+ start:2698 stop:3195 length:498 start_codon:yes stop_codon:yes gene_type:complete
MTEEEMMGRATTLGVMEEQQMNDIFMQGAPRGRFSAQSMNQLIGAFNEVLVAMGVVDPYPSVDAGMTSFPPDLVRGLAMVADAADTVGMKNPVQLANVTDDTDVDLLAAKLLTLAEDPKFIEAMAQIPGEEDDLEEEAAEVVEEEEVAAPMVGDDDTEALLMSRA